LVKGRNVDFAQDPPPDLVVEVDMTHTEHLQDLRTACGILRISDDFARTLPAQNHPTA
jgi:hypothetical protein